MKKAKVLFFAADPRSVRRAGEPRLELDAEVRKIRKRVRTARRHEELDFDTHWAARPGDMVEALGDAHPRVVHFSGHCGTAGLVLVGADASHEHTVGASALAELFKAYRGDIRVVVLNACFSLPQATAIAEVVGCAIGTSTGITDAAAVTFSSSFYRAVAFGDSVQAAFVKARAALAMEHYEERDCPQLVVGSGVDASNVFVLEPQPEPKPKSMFKAKPARAAAGIVSVVLIGATVLHISRNDLEACARAGVPDRPAALAMDLSAVHSSLDRAKADYADRRFDAAFPRFRDLARRGNEEALGYVGAMFLRGQGTVARADSGIHLLRKAAYDRDPKAMTALGDAYQNGEGVNYSLASAREWYHKAVDEKQWPEAMRRLGALDLREQKPDAALTWFQKAARAGSLDARVDLGELYEHGQGVPRDPEVAYCLYRTAADAGSARGKQALAQLKAN